MSEEEEELDPMGWRIGQSVMHGFIDARTRDRVTGRVWIIDRQFPIEISLRGNPLRDLAGCLLTFENPTPAKEENDGLCPVQMGRTGDITASRKIHIYDIPMQNVSELRQRGEPVSSRVGNALSIEWYSNANGRVLLESTGFSITISDYSWRMTSEEEQQQLQKNRDAFDRWSDIVDYESDEDSEDDDDIIDWYMDEFAWEKQLQESDALTARYMELIEAYIDHPEREQLIAREMGWDRFDGIVDDDEDLVFDGDSSTVWDDDDSLPPLEPIAGTEGRDWIRDRDGNVSHPVSARAAALAMNIWRCCKENGMTGEAVNDPDIHNMIFHAQTLSAKLAGALDSLAYEDDPDGGFVVACLKRALKHFGQTIHSISIVTQKNVLPSATLQSFRDEFFAIRQDILNLMKYYRQII